MLFTKHLSPEPECMNFLHRLVVTEQSTYLIVLHLWAYRKKVIVCGFETVFLKCFAQLTQCLYNWPREVLYFCVSSVYMSMDPTVV